MALALLLARSALSQMDVPARSSYVMAVVTPPERPAAASVTSVPRSLAAAASPALAGALLDAGLQAWPLVICGLLKILYDLALLWVFRHVKPPEERTLRGLTRPAQTGLQRGHGSEALRPAHGPHRPAAQGAVCACPCWVSAGAATCCLRRPS